MGRSGWLVAGLSVGLCVGSIAACTPWPAGDACPGGPPADAMKLRSGISTVLLEAGRGTPLPENERSMLALSFCVFHQGEPVRSKEQLQAVIPGKGVPPAIDEMLDVMVVGERRRFWIPEEVGPRPNAWLAGNIIIDVEARGPPPPPPVAPDAPPAEPPAGAQRDPAGMAWTVLTPGAGGAHPTSADVVVVRYRAFDHAGHVVEATPPTGITVLLGGLFHAGATILEKMTAGERVRVWVPERMAAALPPGWPRQAIIVDLELVKILPAK